MAVALVLGDVAAGALASAGYADVRAFRDEVSIGPLGAAAEREAMLDLRAAHWARLMARGAPAGGRDQDGATARIRAELAEDLERLAAALTCGETVEIWAGESLQDLMFLARCAALRGAGTELILRRPRPGRLGPAAGLGALSAAQLRDAPAGHPLGAAERDGLARFWAALIAPDPAPLRDFAAAPPAALRGLGPAAVARLARLPHPVTGLDSLETRLLTELVGLGGGLGGGFGGGGGPVRAGQVIGAALRAGAAGPDLTGDLALLDSLHGLAAPAAGVPLVALSGDGTMGGTEVSLTEAGARVHAGAADRVALNGWRSNLGGLRIDAPPGGEVPRAPLLPARARGAATGRRRARSAGPR